MKWKKMILWFLAIIFFVLITFNLVGFMVSAPKYKGPISDHFNGKTFINLGNVKAKGFKDLLKWASTRDKDPWLEEKNVKFGEQPDETIESGVKLTFVNHSTFLIQTEGLNILTDPIWSERTSPVSFTGPKRMRPPGIKFDDLPNIDLVIISHNHYDHLDVPTLKRLIKKYNPKIITPLGVGKFIENLGAKDIVDMDWWQESGVSENITIACVPAQHFSGRGTFDRDATLWCGYVIKNAGGNIYFAGDTGYGSFFKKIGKKYPNTRISLIPIGAYLPKWFMSPIHISPEEAVQVHKDIGSEVSISMHFGTFPLADDGLHRPVKDLKRALANEGIEDKSFRVMEEGESLFFDY